MPRHLIYKFHSIPHPLYYSAASNQRFYDSKPSINSESITMVYNTPSTSYTLDYLPPVKPSAIALGTVFSHVSQLAVMAPIFGETYHKAKRADSKEEFVRSREAATTASLYGSSLVGSGIQTYAVAALINHTGVMTYKGAAYLGALVFAATTVPTMVGQIFTEKRPMEVVAVKAATNLVDTVGLSMFLTWWGTRPAHDLLR